MKESFQVFEDSFLNEKTGQAAVGVTVVVEGRFQEVLDAILRLSPDYGSYQQVIGAAVAEGITGMIARLKPRE